MYAHETVMNKSLRVSEMVKDRLQAIKSPNEESLGKVVERVLRSYVSEGYISTLVFHFDAIETVLETHTTIPQVELTKAFKVFLLRINKLSYEDQYILCKYRTTLLLTPPLDTLQQQQQQQGNPSMVSSLKVKQ